MDDVKSKSQKKRDADALQQLGVQLIDLSISKLDTLPLTDELRAAIVLAKSLKSHGAVRRQAQLIGKLMRAAESDAIIEAYQHLIAEEQGQVASFHQVEQWRERLLHEGKDALTEFIQKYPSTDVQQLRQHIKKAVDDHSKNTNTGASKALFRLIKVCIE
ncbi:MAG: ribosome biogenesis factor YjgA [Legionellaceae bacterium]|nr:ribosome biogenesis factor YjgA [Legionellaceae bacterium]